MVPIKRVVADMPKCNGDVQKPVENKKPPTKDLVWALDTAKKKKSLSPLGEADLKKLIDIILPNKQAPFRLQLPSIYWMPKIEPLPTRPCPMPTQPFHRWRTEPPVILRWDCLPWHRCCPTSNTTEEFFSFLERLKRIFPSISAGEAMGMWTYIEKRDHCECDDEPIIELCKKDSRPNFRYAF